jgi:hypothetical protein
MATPEHGSAEHLQDVATVLLDVCAVVGYLGPPECMTALAAAIGVSMAYTEGWDAEVWELMGQVAKKECENREKDLNAPEPVAKEVQH